MGKWYQILVCCWRNEENVSTQALPPSSCFIFMYPPFLSCPSPTISIPFFLSLHVWGDPVQQLCDEHSQLGISEDSHEVPLGDWPGPRSYLGRTLTTLCLFYLLRDRTHLTWKQRCYGNRCYSCCVTLPCSGKWWWVFPTECWPS